MGEYPNHRLIPLRPILVLTPARENDRDALTLALCEFPSRSDLQLVTNLLIDSTRNCHPGPCPPCQVALIVPCPSHHSPLTVKCAQASSNNAALTPVCDELCERQRSCGNKEHVCQVSAIDYVTGSRLKPGRYFVITDRASRAISLNWSGATAVRTQRRWSAGGSVRTRRYA